MSFERTAVHFGGGNIGRGFVAQLLNESKYEVIFVDVMDSIINKLQATPTYTVTEVGDDGERTFTIDHYRAINSKFDEAKVIEEISRADTVTCAVGPNILKFIAAVIAKGIEARKLDYPLAVIACENMIGATDALKGFIDTHLSESTKSSLDTKARFANSAIDRIVPNQAPDAGLDVKIEKFFEWCVELPPFKGGKKPEIKGVHFVDDLTPYIERKLFTVNTSHATAAYVGKARGKKFIHEAMQDEEINKIVRSALKNTANLIVTKHGISEAEQDEYVEKIIKRISNPALEDIVERVGRAPLRKLSRKERFVGPAAELAEKGLDYQGLLVPIDAAFRFTDVEGDDESAKLATILKEKSSKEVVQEVCGLAPDHPLFGDIVEIVEKVQKK
ncbi:hypothetical protein EJ06DRAFT_526940 [Trichodelitschia bisporula]|uniref:Mannitol-1-phosphate 5-dehydrogenase n=1 Tax=Trichodelitschia bisporula TaxID=703511 RepID=A0A6G1I590_9PEZI|nr:hypothetical protein EJ06DRAFT_526940 [Trichodelitschia bisporula]